MPVDAELRSWDADAFRARVRAWLGEHGEPRVAGAHPRVPAIAIEYEDGVRDAMAYQRALWAAGLAGVSLPAEYGGGGLAIDAQHILDEEMTGYEDPRTHLMISLGMCVPTLLTHGTDEQCRRWIPPILRGEENWCQPFAREWHIPTGKVITDWRLLLPADMMEALFWQAARPLIADDEPSAVLLAGMVVCAADGMLVNLPDTPGNRAMFGSAGTADDSSPFPQLRVIALTARAGRAVLGAILGGTGAGEQTLLKRLARRRPELFAGRVTCFDRNFPGYDLITAIVDAGGHVVARMKAGIPLPLEPGGGWLPDGSRLTWLNAPSGKKEDRLPVRAAEHNVTLPCGDGGEVSETCTVITTLLDHRAAPADAVRETYLTRWSAAETTFGEDKATITGTGNRTSGPVLRSGSPRLVISEAWAWLTATQLVRASAAAALRSEAAAARALRRKDSAPVTADEESFTAAWRHAIRSMTSSQVTASSSLDALAAAADAAARAALHTLNIPGRQRHSPRTQKARPKFRHAAGTKQTVTGKPQVTVFAPGFP